MIRLIKTILRLALLLLLGAGLLFSYARWVEPRFIDETQLTCAGASLRLPDNGSEAGPLRIAVFADTHFSQYYTPEDFQRVVTRINASQPDLVFFLGDLIDNYNTYDGDIDSITQALSQITTSGRAGTVSQDGTVCSKFAVFGNHDYGGGLENYYIQFMEAGGFQVLVNDTVTLSDWNLTITGIDDMVIGYGDIACASVLPEDCYNIVLAHEPDIVTDMTDYAIDLMVSGHTHGGQINLPFMSDRFLPPYGQIFVNGEYRFENARETLLYVNRGLGTTQLPLRFLASPELTEIVVTPEEL